MSGWVISESKIKRSFLLANHQNLSPIPPPPSFSSDQKQSSNRISPAVLFIIVILAVIFFISGLLHLLVRFLLKQPQSASNSNRNPEISSTDALQRQLQQLFNLHDSGLDQAFIDSLPVFHYKSILGLKEPFDCAVCLCEFAEEDQLRLLPNCSHAFHLDCIDTWLLSNSTCPLCRGALFSCDFPLIDENPSLDFSDSRIEERFAGGDGGEDGFCSGFLAQKSVEMGVNREEIVGVAVPDKKIVPVKLGKFRSLNDGGETSSSNLDARRCYSMGSFQYVLGSSNLQIALFPNNSSVEGGDGDQKQREPNENSAVNLDLEGKKLSSRSKMESFSVSKIWLWPKKGKYPSSSDENNNNMDNSSWIEQHRTRTR